MRAVTYRGTGIRPQRPWPTFCPPPPVIPHRGSSHVPTAQRHRGRIASDGAVVIRGLNRVRRHVTASQFIVAALGLACHSPGVPARLTGTRASCSTPSSDPGTVGVVAETHDRDWVGIEMKPDYVTLARERIRAAREKRERLPWPRSQLGASSVTLRLHQDEPNRGSPAAPHRGGFVTMSHKHPLAVHHEGDTMKTMAIRLERTDLPRPANPGRHP